MPQDNKNRFISNKRLENYNNFDEYKQNIYLKDWLEL